MESYDSVMAEINAQVAAEVRKAAGVSEADALNRVFKAHPDLYQRYRLAAGRQLASRPTPAARPYQTPMGAEVEALKRADTLVHKQAGLTPAEALSRVFADDPELYQRYTREASLGRADPAAPAVSTPPVVKATDLLAGDMLALAKALNPEDPLGRGMARCRLALGELVKTIERKKRAAA
jgi:hypothetical protein